MLRFQWNALRVGDHVDVHDPDDVDMRLVPGVVMMVQSRRSASGSASGSAANGGGSNDIGIRLGSMTGVAGTPGNGSHVVRPGRLAVHLDAVDAARDCWRCAGATDRAHAHA